MSENRGRGRGITATVLAGYVKSFSFLLIPVLWLLMDGYNFWMSKASSIDGLLWLNYFKRILVLLTRSSLVRIKLWF